VSGLWQFGKDYVWRSWGRDPVPITIPPSAAFTETANNTVVTFDGTPSAAYGTTIASYAWTFGDGATGTGAKPVHTYTVTPGTQVQFSVKLTVTDTRGGKASVTQGVSVTASAGNLPPTASFTGTILSDGLTFTGDATASSDADGTITAYDWDFGDGTTHATTPTVTHVYSAGATWKVTLAVTDNKGASGTKTGNFTTTANNKPPTATFTSQLAADKVTVTFNAAASTDADGSVAAYIWDFGDGLTGSGKTPVHTYAASGPFTVTLVVQDNLGANSAPFRAQVFPVTSGGGGSTTPVYLQGSMTQGIPGTVPVYTFATLGLTTTTTNLQTIVDKLQSSTLAAGIIQLPGNGWIGSIPNFSHQGSNYGINAPSKVLGYLGDITGGTLNTAIQVEPSGMTPAQLTSSASSTGIDVAAIRTGSNTFYMAGLQLIGSDQQAITDYTATGPNPSRWSGVQANNVGPNSIFQNLLFSGFGRATASSPPGEIGVWNETHAVNLTFRRNEEDGRLPVGSPSRPNSTVADPYAEGWRRSGGIQWNASTGFLVEDVECHDTWASGFTISFTSTPLTANQAHDFTLRRLHVYNNSGHGVSTVTGQNSGSFRPLNLEFSHGVNHIRQCHFSSPYWSATDNAHIKMWIYTSNFAGAAYTADPTTEWYIYQPTWDDAHPNDNGCFSIYLGSLSVNTTYRIPTVYLTGAADDTSNPATPYVVRVGTKVPSNISTANNYFVVKYT
jgi:PKD repeat protein